MKLVSKIFLIIAVLATPVTTEAQDDFMSEAEAKKLYRELFIGSAIDKIEYTGNPAKCRPGVVSDSIYIKAIMRINYFRLMAGLNKIKLDSSLNPMAQAAAMMMDANGKLSHTPDKSWKCYSKLGADGAIKSCLGISEWADFPESAFVTGFMRDYGTSNYFVGHRKWLLHSQLARVGYGATPGSEAILTVEGLDRTIDCKQEFIAYPWNGYIDSDLIFPKWSFSIPDKYEVDFKNTSITMKIDDKSIHLEKQKLYPNYLDHTIVWLVDGLFTEEEITYAETSEKLETTYLNKRIEVTIKNVKVDGKTRHFNYTVIPKDF